jgi:hypothetical protein
VNATIVIIERLVSQQRKIDYELDWEKKGFLDEGEGGLKPPPDDSTER